MESSSTSARLDSFRLTNFVAVTIEMLQSGYRAITMRTAVRAVMAFLFDVLKHLAIFRIGTQLMHH